MSVPVSNFRPIWAFTIATALLLALPALATQQPNCAPAILRESGTPQQAVGVVDAISSGSLFAAALRRRNLLPVHILSTLDMDREILESIHYEDFDPANQFIFDGSIEQLLGQMDSLPLVAVLPGGETGVNLADVVSERLGLVTNGTAKSSARRDKYEQVETCSAAEIPVAKQTLVVNHHTATTRARQTPGAPHPHAELAHQDIEECVAQITEQTVAHLGWPVVIKPRDAAASFKVEIAFSLEQVREAVKAVLSATNPLNGRRLTEALLQEYLDGPEYVVDAVLRNGRVYITDVSRYNKVPFNGKPVVYESEDLIPIDEATKLGLIEYAHRVFDATDIRNGAAHMEIKLTSKGPRLVEVGARLSGGGFPVLVEEVTGVSPVELALDAYLDGEAFDAHFDRPRKFRPAKVVYLMTEKSGELADLPYMAEIEALPSFFRKKMSVEPGKPLKPTTNFLDYPGQIELVHDDPAQVEKDYKHIRQLELRSNFYQMLTP